MVASAVTEERSFLISTHQVRDLELLIDPIIILDQGKILLNNGTSEISDNLVIRQQTEEPVEEEVLYYETDIKGYTVLSKNSGDEYSNIDIEFLFNAAIENPSEFSKMFIGE